MISQVYVIGVLFEPVVKIGCSRSPKRRLQTLRSDRTHFPVDMDRRRLTLLSQQPGDLKLEKLLHWHFADKWVIGEWYDLAGSDPVEQVRTAITHLQLHGLAPSAAFGPAELPSPERVRPAEDRLIVDHKAAAAKLRADLELWRGKRLPPRLRAGVKLRWRRPKESPHLRITIDGRLALTVEQAADRYHLKARSMSSALSRLAVTPDAKLDGLKSLYLAGRLDALMKARPGRGANWRKPPKET